MINNQLIAILIGLLFLAASAWSAEYKTPDEARDLIDRIEREHIAQGGKR